MVTAQAAQAETATSSSQSEQQSNAVQGCSYGSGGPNADALCWIDFSTFGTVSADSMPANKPLTINLGRYKITMNVKVSAGADGANGVLATQLPTWTESGKSGSLLGATKAGQDYYVGTSGKPALYQVVANPGITTDFAQRDTVSLEQIQVFDTQNNDAPVTSGYSLVMADAESTGPSHEGFTWTSDKALNKYLDVTPSGWAEPCTKGLTGLGSTSVTCETANGTVPGNGIVMVSADAPTTISSAFRNSAGGNSRQGIAIAVVFSTATAGLNVVQNGGSNAGFTVTAKNEGGTLGATSSSGGETSSGKQQFLSGAEGSKTTYSIAKSTGSNTTTEDAYKIIWECQVNGEKYTPMLSADGKTATVTTPANGASSCVATATAEPPTTGDAAKTINPNTTAELSPETTPGAGAIKAVAFADGSTTKTVPGEGTWTIKLVDGQPKAKFTPETGFTGKVTEQPYTVTDVNELTATGKLDVTINVPPTTGDASKTINPNETATLTPKTTPGTGDITAVVFDNGQQSKTVAGEGTWTIKLVDGQPVATFTPDKDYTGKVTPQSYTVTDANGLTATGKLDVTINVPPTTGDASKTVAQGESATLMPKSTRGTGALTQVAFDNGQQSKTVPGEGTWTIDLVNGQPKAKFTPEAGFTGKVTEQSYTVTDVNGLTATGKLDVTIKPTTGDASKTINPNTTATLTPKTIPGSGDITSAAFADGSTAKTVAGEGTWTIKLVDGQPVATFTPDKDYSGKVTPQSYTVTDANGLTATGKLDVTINVPPTTGDASKTINPNTTAELSPETTKGTGDIKTVAFADGSTTKTVPGEGTWTIELVNGQPKATFTPDKDYTGKVTEQSYTVTDANGLTASGKLDVTINVPPTTGDASKAINPNETATLTPKTVPGSGEITAVVFDNGQQSKTVAGEGTWTIKLVDGQPVATFTPDKDYSGKVTPQSYTVTDANGLTATGKLEVTINVPAVTVVPSTPSTSSSSDGAVSVPAGKSLAHTGAAVASVLVVAGLLAVLGFAILRIRKNSKN
ncbi:Ig-like domain-containing protein [Bifidobacterium crudilactis]|jgi:CshA-type fibril repeat protein|uniref:Ig-like domain-containing protein n=1 Tax=Bifidobacterium crudilactis TaxID=327277 RepID=UPI002F35F75E